MADRYRRSRSDRYQQGHDQGYPRQTEQFQTDEPGAFNESRRDYQGFASHHEMDDPLGGPGYDRDHGIQRGYERSDEGRSWRDRENRQGGRNRYERGGSEVSEPGYSGEPGYFGSSTGAAPGQTFSRGEYSGRGRGRDYGSRDEHRGFFERAGEEIASWFGEDDGETRRERSSHRGRGPGNYKRSDQRILEDVCDRLTDDHWVDASDISVTAEGGEVTLDGTVSSLQQKRRAEDCAQGVSGINHVQNNLRVAKNGGSNWDGNRTDTTPGTLA